MTGREAMKPTTTGERIKQIRNHNGLTLDQVAKRAGVSKGFLSGVENNKYDASGANLLQIANVLGASVDYLLRGGTTKEYNNVPIEIPKELSDLAEEEGLTFKETLTLLDIDNSIMARRSSKIKEAKTKAYWAKLLKGFKEFIPVVGLFQVCKGFSIFNRGYR